MELISSWFKFTPFTIFAFLLVFSAYPENQAIAQDYDASHKVSCPAIKEFTGNRNFKIGFSTWPFGPDEQDKDELYQFIDGNTDIYSEQVDDKIPWTELLANKPYPAGFIGDIQRRKTRRLNKDLLLSISILNDGRDNIADDFSGNDYDINSAFADKRFSDAYFKYVNYLIAQLKPRYVVFGMEVNELYLNKGKGTWYLYKQFMDKLRVRLKKAHPEILFSESITLHNLQTADIENRGVYLDDVKNYTKNFDFFSVSFHPLFMGIKTKAETLAALNYLNGFTDKKIAFVETSQVAEDLFVLLFLLSVDGNTCTQAEYLQTLFEYSQSHNVDFIIWFTFKDYDRLWETFPFYAKGLGKIWRDTGLIDQDNVLREGYDVWLQWYKK